MKTMFNRQEPQKLFEESKIFLFFHDLFRYPTQEQWEWLNLHEVKMVMESLLREYEIHEAGKNVYPKSYEDYEENFLRFFEVGTPHPPCPLIESHWNKNEPVPKILHENLMFYKAFGLQLKKDAEETADHLRFQLEFYSYLITLSLKKLRTGGSVEPLDQLLKARRDYLHRHLLNWIPAAAKRIKQAAPESFGTVWLHLLECCLAEQKLTLSNTFHERETL